MACDADAAHVMENCWSTPWQPGRKSSSNTLRPLLSEHRSDGEAIAIPNTFKEATESPQAVKWKEASNIEMASLEKNEVFDLVASASVPSEKVIATKLVFRVKADHALKGRVVVQGWGQVPGVDSGCTYAPVCRIQSHQDGTRHC